MSAQAVLHIGTKKTGTTYLQVLLKRNQAKLRESGWEYPAFLGRRNHLMMAVPFAADKDSDIHRAVNLTTRAQTQGHLANLNAELSEQVKPGQKWLFSSEFFASRLRSEAEIRACVGFLRQHFDDIKVVVYFRRPEFMVASTYSQSVKEGLSHRLDMAYVERRSHDFSHLPLLAKWQAVLGSDNVKTMPYLERYRSDSEAMLDSFLTTVGVPLRDDWSQPDRTSSNQSLRSEGLAVFAPSTLCSPGRRTTPGHSFINARRWPVEFNRQQVATGLASLLR